MKKLSHLLWSALLVLLLFTGCKREVKIFYSSFLVTFNANGGIGNDRTQIFNHDQEKELLPNTFTKAHYSFAGWIAAPKQEFDEAGNPKYTVYTDKQKISISEDTTLYAQWEKAEIITIPSNSKKTLTINYTKDSDTARWPQDLTALDVYFQEVKDKDGNFKILDDIPFITMETAAKLFEGYLFYGEDPNYTKLSVKDHIFTLTRNNETAVLDFDEGTVTFSERNEFVKPEVCKYACDFCSQETVYLNNGVRHYFDFNDKYSYVVKGQAKTINLSNYDIPLAVNENGQGFIPLQTFTDLFWTNFSGFGYNGKALYLFGNHDDALNKEYFDNSLFTNKQISEHLQKFSVNELCMEMDNFYGLKEQEKISDFKDYINTLTTFDKVPVVEYFYNTDPLKRTYGMYDFISYYIDDLHSAYIQGGPYLTFDKMQNEANNAYLFSKRNTGTSSYKKQKDMIGLFLKKGMSFKDLNGNSGNSAFKMYEEKSDENGITVILSFDEFTGNISHDYYNPENLHYLEELVNSNKASTVELVLYAASRIRNYDINTQKINVIIDLSCNAGGRVDGAAFLLSWLKNETPISIRDTFTNAKYNITYLIDSNLDNVFDENDSLSNYANVYCITSGFSFSCGNLLPFALKNNGATLIGQQSGGGACSVLSRITPDGQLYTHSSTLEIEKNINGSYYNVDKGVEPDVYVKDFENIYDRTKLLALIDSLK